MNEGLFCTVYYKFAQWVRVFMTLGEELISTLDLWDFMVLATRSTVVVFKIKAAAAEFLLCVLEDVWISEYFQTT